MRLPAAVFVTVLAAVAGCTRTPDAPTTAGPADGAVEVRTVRDDSTGAELPRVTLAGRPEIERLVNAGLDSLSASLTCGADAGSDTTDSSFVTRASVAHAADDVLSVSVHSSYYCGTAYPTNDANLSVTYDLTTGASVPFEALFRDYDADRAAIAGVLQTTLFSAAGSGDAGAAGEGADGCQDMFTAEGVAAMSFAYTLTGEGLAVQPQFPHVIEACAVESTIPYGSLRAYAAEGGVLARVADASSTLQ